MRFIMKMTDSHTQIGLNHLVWLIIIITLSIFTYSTELYAKKVVTINQEDAFPSMDLFYDGDSQRDLKLSLEEMMGLYLVDPPRRHKSEITRLSDTQIHFHLWYPIANKSQRTLWSIAAHWLIFGRTQFASGAQGLFSELPGVNRVSLSFHEVYRPNEKSKQRKIKVDRIYSYLLVSITRDAFERLDLLKLKQCAINFDCTDEIRRMFTLIKLNSKYLRKIKNQR
jgi:hypothetical protein